MAGKDDRVPLESLECFCSGTLNVFVDSGCRTVEFSEANSTLLLTDVLIVFKCWLFRAPGIGCFLALRQQHLHQTQNGLSPRGFFARVGFAIS